MKHVKKNILLGLSASLLFLSASFILSIPLNGAPFTVAFSFQLPQIRLPWVSTAVNSGQLISSKSISPGSPIVQNDKVVLFGGSGGVGQIVTKKLRYRREKNYQICVVARDAARAKEMLVDDAEGEVNVVELNLVGEARASDEELKAALDGAAGVVISVGTTAFPTKRWSGGNTPKAIDEEAVTRIVNIAAELASSQPTPTIRRVILLTSIGVDRTKEMPFLILNLFGVLDAKRAGEDALKKAASKGKFSYAIVRPGRLVGGPYTNIDFASMFQIEGGAENGVSIEKGDTLLGDCKRDVTAEAVLQCLENDACRDVEFSMVSNEKKAMTNEEWSEAFLAMKH